MRLSYFLLFVLSFLWARPALPVSNMPLGQHILVAEAAPPIEPAKPKKARKIKQNRPNLGIDWDELGWVLLALLAVFVLSIWFGGLFVTFFGALTAGTLAGLPAEYFILMSVIGFLGSVGFALWGFLAEAEAGPLFFTLFFSLMSMLMGYSFLLAGAGLAWLWGLGLGLLIAGFLFLVGAYIFAYVNLNTIGEQGVFLSALLIFLGGLLSHAIGRVIGFTAAFWWTAGPVGFAFLLLLIGAIIWAKYEVD